VSGLYRHFVANEVPFWIMTLIIIGFISRKEKTR